MNEKIGKFIAETRNEAKLTQKELAEKIGVSDKTVSKWECGKSLPDISYLDALCNALAINMNVLLSGAKSYPDILQVLLIISIPNGALVTAITFITILVQLSEPEQLGIHLSICSLSVVYSVMEYLVVFCLKQHANETEK